MASSAPLSATELSRLHRQRRLESSSPIHLHHKVTPNQITRRTRRASKSISNDEAGKSLTNAAVVSVSSSFDEEITAANSSSSGEATKDRGIADKENGSNLPGTPTPSQGHDNSSNRSFSFSSFSAPFPSEQPEGIISPSPPHTPSSTTAKARAVPVTPTTAPDSPAGSVSGAHAFRSPRHPLVSPRPALSRSSSSRSMPANPAGTTLDSDMPLDELMAAAIAPTTIGSGGFATANNSRLLPPSSRWPSLDTPLLSSSRQHK